MIGLSVSLSLNFLRDDVEEFEYRFIFLERLESVLLGNGLDDVRNLMLQVTGPEVDRLERLAGSVLLAVVKSILFLQPAALCFRSLSDQVIVDLTTTFVDPCRDDMQMLAIDVAMLVDYVGLITESEAFQVIPSDRYQLLIGQMIIFMRIERYVQYRIFRFQIRR